MTRQHMITGAKKTPRRAPRSLAWPGCPSRRRRTMSRTRPCSPKRGHACRPVACRSVQRGAWRLTDHDACLPPSWLPRRSERMRLSSLPVTRPLRAPVPCPTPRGMPTPLPRRRMLSVPCPCPCPVSLSLSDLRRNRRWHVQPCLAEILPDVLQRPVIR